MSAKLTITIPAWLDRICAWPVTAYRRCKFGFSFRKIYLGEGRFALVDPQDFYWLNNFHWHTEIKCKLIYAARNVTSAGEKKTIFSMHREIMNFPDGRLVDHQNGNTLDNRRENLRLATRAQNNCNRRKTISKTSSRFIGVCFHKLRQRWCANIGHNGKKIWLGSFASEIDAAKAYDAAARKYHGEFAKLNFSEEIERSPKRLNLRLANWLGAKLNFPEVFSPATLGFASGETGWQGLLNCRRGLSSVGAILLALVLTVLVFLGCKATNKTTVSRSVDMPADKKITLKNAQAKRVWEIFRQVSAIPRCSKNEQRIIEWLKSFAKSQNLACRGDAVGNIVIELPSSKGYEKSPAVILQSHVDMVCEKTPDSKHDFSKDPIEIIEQDGWVCADGTTLGADDGLGVSLALALTGEKLPRPRLELLFTVDEETGLTGANALQQGFITGKYLINLDGEDESFIIGCAGGEQIEITLALDWCDAPAGFDCLSLNVSGLRGGHSGVDIDKQRANAIKLLARILKGLQEQFDFSICSVDGGKAANAIPRDAQAILSFGTSALPAIKKQLAELELSFKKEFSATEPNLKVELEKVALRPAVSISNQQSKITNLLSALPTGVYRMSDKFKGTVETSNNLARVETIRDENLLRITTMQRGFEQSSMADLTGKIVSIANLAGAITKIYSRYPGWEPDTNSHLLKQCVEVYAGLRGKTPPTKVVHAGLEPAVIKQKFPNIEAISVGPTIQNPHSPQERLNIASVDNVWGFLLALLPSLK